MDYEKSLEELETALSELKEENRTVPVIVEGEKDREALLKLNLPGEIIGLNKGLSVSDFCDRLAQQYQEVILLVDWDRRGGHLCSTIMRHLKGRTRCNTRYREVFARRCMIRTVEGLPSWLTTLQKLVEGK